METRDILDSENNIIGTLSFPENTSENVWQQALSHYSKSIGNSWDSIKNKRKELFQETEWIKSRHRDEKDSGAQTTLTDEQYSQWLTYWQALRDLPQTFLNPNEVIFPVQPRF